MLKPVQNSVQKNISLFERADNEKFLEEFVTMEAWLNDNIPISGELYREYVKFLYQQNLMVQNKLPVGKHIINLKNITCPVLNLMASADDLVPCAQSEPFNDLVGSQDRKAIKFKAGHIGLAVGSRAHRELWSARSNGWPNAPRRAEAVSRNVIRSGLADASGLSLRHYAGRFACPAAQLPKRSRGLSVISKQPGFSIVPSLLAALLLTTTVCESASADHWPEFRGPSYQGHAAPQGLPTRWSESENVTWKTPIPGTGWSSPVITDGLVWMTTAFFTELNDAQRAKRVSGKKNAKSLDAVDDLRLHAVGVDQVTGKIRHNIRLLAPKNPPPIHSLNSHASPTPAIEKGRLYCHFGTHGTVCVNTGTGKILWKNTDIPISHFVGPGSSITIWKDSVIFHADGTEVQSIVALDKRTGKLKWRTQRSGEMDEDPDFKKAYGTPLVSHIHGRDQLISPAANWLYAYDPDNGTELWKVSYEALGFSIVPRPVVGHGMIYFSTSFMPAQILAVKVEDADGDCTPEIAWRFKKGAPSQPSPLLVGDELYVINDRSGIATCLDARSGETIWKERIGGNYSASPLHTEGHLYFSNREGVTTVLKAGRTPDTIASNTLDGKHMASLAAAGGAFFVRTDSNLYRIESARE